MSRAGRQPLGLLRLPSARQACAQGLPGQHAAEGRVCRQRQDLWQPSPERGAVRSGPAHRAPPRAPFDARARVTPAVATQVCTHHGQWPRAADLGQCAGAALQPERPQPSLGERHHLHPHAQRLAVLGRGVGPVRPQGRGLGDGADHARRVGVRGAATGHCATPTDTGADCSLRQGQPGRIQPVVATLGC